MYNEINLMVSHPEAYHAGPIPSVAQIHRGRYLSIMDGCECTHDHDDPWPAVRLLLDLAELLRERESDGGYAFKIGPLEALFWSSDADLVTKDPCAPRSKLLLRVPELIDHARFRLARQSLAQRGDHCDLNCVGLEDLSYGLCMQIIHVGPHNDKHGSIGAMLESASRQGYELSGPRHEVYLTHPSETPAHQMRTILRMSIHQGTAPHAVVLPDGWGLSGPRSSDSQPH